MKRPKIVMVGNNKGGVGKTFVSKGLGEYGVLVRKQKVLLLDFDPQTNLSQRSVPMRLVRDPGQSDEYVPPLHPDYLTNPGDPEFAGWNGVSDTSDIWMSPYTVFYPTKYKNLDILPAQSRRLQKIEAVTEEDTFTKVVHRLREFLLHPGILDGYDLVIIDTRPSKGPLVQAALHAATHLIIPSQMEPPSVEGLHGMLSVRVQANLHRPKTDPLKLIGILPNIFRKGATMHEEFLNVFTKNPDVGKYILPVVVNDWVGYKSSMMYEADSIFNNAPADKHRQQLEQVFGVIFDRLEAE